MARIHLNKMEIILNNNKTTYQVGDHINGKLKISLNGVLLLKDVKIGLVCMAEVKWVEYPGTRYHRDGHIYHDKCQFLDLAYEIPPKNRDDYVDKGENEIPFTLKLPQSGIPSSFESIHGCVTYYLEAIVEEPIINETHRTGMQIIVEAPFRENLSLSVGGSTEKDIGILNFGSGSVSLYASIVKKGHIAGELIEVHCTVENMSTLNVTPRATFYQTQIFMCGERHKTIETSLTEPIIGEVVEANSNNTETLFVLIPEDIPLSIKSSIITVKYFIHVTLDIPHAIDLHINIPIVITNKYVLNDLSLKTPE